MQPVKIELNLHRIRAINAQLESLKWEPSNARQENVARAILGQVGKRLAKKQIDVFPSAKTFKFKMEYFEADALENFIRSVLWELDGDTDGHTLRVIADDINQKLA